VAATGEGQSNPSAMKPKITGSLSRGREDAKRLRLAKLQLIKSHVAPSVTVSKITAP